MCVFDVAVSRTSKTKRQRAAAHARSSLPAGVQQPSSGLLRQQVKLRIQATLVFQVNSVLLNQQSRWHFAQSAQQHTRAAGTVGCFDGLHERLLRLTFVHRATTSKSAAHESRQRGLSVDEACAGAIDASCATGCSN